MPDDGVAIPVTLQIKSTILMIVQTIRKIQQSIRQIYQPASIFHLKNSNTLLWWLPFLIETVMSD
jgi:hypothetical protein